jgi:hypothetical protein
MRNIKLRRIAGNLSCYSCGLLRRHLYIDVENVKCTACASCGQITTRKTLLGPIGKVPDLSEAELALLLLMEES